MKITILGITYSFKLSFKVSRSKVYTYSIPDTGVYDCSVINNHRKNPAVRYWKCGEGGRPVYKIPLPKDNAYYLILNRSEINSAKEVKILCTY